MSTKTTITMLTSQLHNAVRTLLVAISLAVLPLTGHAKTYLVAVGISDYPGTKNDLRLPHNDAATMEWLYKENKQSVLLLRNDNAKLSTVKAALQKMADVATKDDIVVFYFSGHGIKGGFVCYDGFLYYQDIYAAMAECKSQSKMVFADACYSGAIRQQKRSSSKNSTQTSTVQNIMFFLSCRSNEMSIETPKMTNGFFTYALQHGLRGGADKNKDRIITAKELFNYVSTKVKKESRNRQHPVMWGKFPDNMAVMKW